MSLLARFPALFVVAALGASATAAKRPVTVTDGIAMTRLADAAYFAGTPSKGRVAYFSPDGRRFVVLLRKGNLKNNANEYSLLLFETSAALRSPTPEVLLTLSSSSNQDAIGNIRWQLDNETITFLGERPGEASQVYALNLRTKELKKLTSHPTSISFYDITRDGREVLYTADPPPKNVMTSERTRREGIVIANQLLADVLAGDSAPSWWEGGDQLFLMKQGQAPDRVPVEDYLHPEATFLSLSPDGRYALIRTWVRGETPTSWANYDSELVHTRVTGKRRIGEFNAGLMRFLLLDTRDGSIAPLLNTPMEWYNGTAAWAQDGRSLFLTTRLPVDVEDPVQSEERKKKVYDVQVTFPDMRIRTIRDLDFRGMIREERAKRGAGNTNTEIEVLLEEDSNTPPKIYVSDKKTHKKVLLVDLNPQFDELSLGKVQSIKWKATDGHEVQGGLYLPPDYTPAERFPLVIQTHGFDSSRFSMDGLNDWSTGFAARPLASAGLAVLQVGGPTTEHSEVSNTPREGPFAMTEFEGAIDYLDGRGLIDRNRVGITGFSRTFFHVAYTLTHSKYRFSAAILTDGVDAGYFQYIVFGSGDIVPLNGGAPFGEGVSMWLKNSPSFSLDKVHTPVRLVAHGPVSVLGGWEWFSGLSLQEKPVDFIYLPDAPHLVVKPWERRTSQQGAVDWFRFWLQGYEDSDPTKTEQYTRWEKLCDLQVAQNPNQP